MNTLRKFALTAAALVGLGALPATAGHDSHDGLYRHVCEIDSAADRLESSNRKGFEASARHCRPTSLELSFRGCVVDFELATRNFRTSYAGRDLNAIRSCAKDLRRRYDSLCSTARRIKLGSTTKGYLRVIGDRLSCLERDLASARSVRVSAPVLVPTPHPVAVVAPVGHAGSHGYHPAPHTPIYRDSRGYAGASGSRLAAHPHHTGHALGAPVARAIPSAPPSFIPAPHGAPACSPTVARPTVTFRW